MIYHLIRRLMYLYQFAFTFSMLYNDYKFDIYFHHIHGNILLSIQNVTDILSLKNLYYLLLWTFFIRQLFNFYIHMLMFSLQRSPHETMPFPQSQTDRKSSSMIGSQRSGSSQSKLIALQCTSQYVEIAQIYYSIQTYITCV